MALGADGRIYVPCRSWEYRPDGVRVAMLTIDEDFIGEFGSYGDADGQFTWPTSIALDSSQNVYITDELLNRVSVFDKDGQFLSKWGTAGSGDGQLNKPSGIRADKEDNFYLVDSANNRVQKFTKDGKFLAKWGQAGSGPGQFNLPWGLTIDSAGHVYVADWRNDRIQKFAPNGELLAEFGATGSGDGQFNRPVGLSVDKDGDIYIADWGNNRVQVLTPEGRHITTFLGEAGLSKWGAEKLQANPDMVRQRNLVRDKSVEEALWRPKAVAIDDEGRGDHPGLGPQPDSGVPEGKLLDPDPRKGAADTGADPVNSLRGFGGSVPCHAQGSPRGNQGPPESGGP